MIHIYHDCSRHYDPLPGGLRFDMAGVEFTHEEDRCSFGTLLLRANPTNDSALMASDALNQFYAFSSNRRTDR